jgi:hypothetical protein
VVSGRDAVRQHGPPKRWYPTTTLHSVTSQKASTWILTVVKTSNVEAEESFFHYKSALSVVKSDFSTTLLRQICVNYISADSLEFCPRSVSITVPFGQFVWTFLTNVCEFISSSIVERISRRLLSFWPDIACAVLECVTRLKKTGMPCKGIRL